VGGSLQGVTAGLNQSIRLGVDAAGNEDPGYDVQVRIAGEQHLIPSGNLGVWTNPLKPLFGIDLQLGASVQLPREVQATGKLTVEKIGDKAQADFFDSGLATLDADQATATAQFSLPPFWRVGAKYQNDDLLGDGKRTVGLDVELAGVLEQWSAYDHVFLTTKDITFTAAGAEPAPLPPIVQPKDWTDAFSVRAGGTVALWDRMLELHGGGFYESNAIPNSTYTVEVVCGDKVGLGAGLSGKLWGARLDVAYSHVFVFDRKVGQESIVTAGNVAPAALTGDSDPVTRVAIGTYRAGFDLLNVGLTVAFDEMFGFGPHAPKP
jgi:long-subunit fatty acid transport protein